jgi:outer membrane immunogenic protein
MKKFFLASVVGIALATGTPADAADLRPRYQAPLPPMVAPVPFFSWTGCYIGANIGGAWAHKDFSSFDNVDEGSHSAPGIAGGGQIGCDYQLASNWLIGIQGMLDGAHLTGDHVLPDDFDARFHTKVGWFGTVTGRLGFLVTPSFLVYGKGGVAFVGDDHSFTSTVSGNASTGNLTRTGWDAGGGLEWRFLPNWSLWVEYDHMGFGTKAENFLFNGGSFAFQENVKQSVDKLLVGFNYRFEWGKAPVAAAY